MELHFIAGYCLALSLLGFAMMGIDKRRAKKGARRISEKALLLAALLGGSPGSLLGMYVFRHKTKHRQFKYGLPAMLVLHAALLGAWMWQASEHFCRAG